MNRPDLVVGGYKAPITREKVAPYVIGASIVALVICTIAYFNTKGAC